MHWLRLAQLGRKAYWRLFKPSTLGSLCMVTSEDRVLLVRQVYESGWHLPGGGLKRGESFGDAARREVREETGLSLLDVRLFGLYHTRTAGKSDHIAVFVASDYEGTPHPASYEIEAVDFVSPRDLPPGTDEFTRRRIEEYLQGGPVSTASPR